MPPPQRPGRVTRDSLGRHQETASAPGPQAAHLPHHSLPTNSSGWAMRCCCPAGVPGRHDSARPGRVHPLRSPEQGVLSLPRPPQLSTLPSHRTSLPQIPPGEATTVSQGFRVPRLTCWVARLLEMRPGVWEQQHGRLALRATLQSISTHVTWRVTPRATRPSRTGANLTTRDYKTTGVQRGPGDGRAAAGAARLA